MAEAQRKRIVFMGTPEFAALVLQTILAAPAYEVSGVFTQPDRRSGRGHKLVPSPVHKLAASFSLPLFQPPSLRSSDVVRQLAGLKPDFLIVAAYGLILPPEVLAIPKIASINVHASLLPFYRGAAPVQRAIMENWQPDAETGVSIMQMTAGLDTGPVYARVRVPISSRNAGAMLVELAHIGGQLLLQTLAGIMENDIKAEPQDESVASYAAKLQKQDGQIDWNRPLLAVDAHIRGVTPWPGAQTEFLISEKPFSVNILSGRPGEFEENLKAGEIIRTPAGLNIACADGWYILEKVLPPGKKPMSSKEFANGYCRQTSGNCGYAR